MKLVLPTMDYLEPEDLRASTIPDKYISSINTLVLSDVLPEGEYYVNHFVLGKEAVVKSGLLEGPYNEEQEAGQRQLSEMVHNVVTKCFGNVEQNRNGELIVSKKITQRDIANLIQWYNQSNLVTESSSSLSLRYELFSSEQEMEETLRNSGISLRKIYALREIGGMREEASWNGIGVQLYQGYGARFDQGLQAIINRGFERYLRPQEAFGLMIDIMKKKVSPQLQEIFHYSNYEWLNLAWEVKGNSLIAYLDPVGLQWQEYTDPVTKANKYKYHTPTFTAKEKKVFSIEKMHSGKIKGRHDLSEFSDDFIQFHCGRSFAVLPEALRKKVKIDLPPKNLLVPVAHAPENLIFGHIGCNGTPRGVRK